MMSEQKIMHNPPPHTSCLCKSQCTSFSLDGGLSLLVCAYVRQKQNHSSTAGISLEPDSSSMVEIYVGFRAGGLRWCTAVRTVLLYTTVGKNVIEKHKIVLTQHVQTR